MVLTTRDKIRELRKDKVVCLFDEKDILFTNEISRNINVVWGITDKIMRELVEEGRVAGNKYDGYRLPARRVTLLNKFKKMINA